MGIIYRNIFACDSLGNKLISKLEFSAGGVSIKRDNNWIRDSYQYDAAFEGDTMIGFQSNFYAAYTFITGQKHTAILQDTTVLLEHMDPYKGPMHQFVSKISSKKKISEKPTFTPAVFKDFSQLGKDAKNELLGILNVLNQFLTISEKREIFKYDSISVLIISPNFFDEDIIQIKSLLNELNPTLDQLSDLSYSKQKLFYSTIHDILIGYSGSNDLINQYKSVHNYLTFENIHSYEYTALEFKAVEMMEEILPLLFGYRFFAALKLGAILFYKEGGIIDFQPISFSRSLAQENFNVRRIKAINTVDILPYSLRLSSIYETILICYFVFGQATVFDVVGKGQKVLYTTGAAPFLSDLVSGKYVKPNNPLNYFGDYGFLIKLFLKRYGNVILPRFEVRKNIDGKTAIMDGFARLFQTLYSAEIIKESGRNFGINIFEDDSNTWSKSSINYAVLKTFEYLVKPTTIDPTDFLRSVFRGSVPINSYKFYSKYLDSGDTADYTSHDRSAFWNSIGEVFLDYPTLSQFFGRDFGTIQPSLFYTRNNLRGNPQPLTVEGLLTPEFVEKIDHLYNNFYQILSTKYQNGEKITVIFHQDSLGGIYGNSILNKILSDDIKDKFGDLVRSRSSSISFTFQKQGNEILNEEEFRSFIASITFYLVMFNSIALFKESSGLYGLIASQRELFTANYIYELDGGSSQLSATGQQILEAYQSGWNINNEGRIVWNYGDCWPIYLFNDAMELIEWYSNRFLNGGNIKNLI